MHLAGELGGGLLGARLALQRLLDLLPVWALLEVVHARLALERVRDVRERAVHVGDVRLAQQRRLHVRRVRLGLELALEVLHCVTLRLDHVVQRLEGRADHVLDVAPLVHALQQVVHHHRARLAPPRVTLLRPHARTHGQRRSQVAHSGAAALPAFFSFHPASIR